MNISSIIEDKMLYLGFNPSMNGFYFMKEAILYLINNNKEFYQIRLYKDVYKSVSEKTYYSVSSVERNIRRLINNAVISNSELCLNISDRVTGKTTNASVIAYLLMLVRREIQSS